MVGLFIISSVLVSCGKEERKGDLITIDYSTQIRSLGLENLSESLENYWKFSFSKYTMKVVCSCSCEDVARLPEIWNSGKHLLPAIVSTTSIKYTNCDSLRYIYKNECSYSSLGEAHDSILNFVNSRNYLSSPEKVLINEFVYQVKTNTLDKGYIINKWNNLPYNPILNNDISLAFIQVGLSIVDFHTKFPGSFGSKDDEPQAIFNHVMGALAGGVLGVLADCVEDVYYNTEYGKSDVWGDFKRSFVKGAITGAVGSV